MEIRICILFVCLFFLTLSCNKQMQLEQKIDGSWNIESLQEDEIESIQDMNLRVMTFIYSDKSGFVPDWRVYRKKSLKNNSDIENYYVLKEKGKSFIVFETKNVYFSDTFLIEKLTVNELEISNKNKKVVAKKGY